MSKKRNALTIGSSAAAVLALVVLPQGLPASAGPGTSQLISSELRLPIALQGQSLVSCSLFDPNDCKSEPLTPTVSVESLGVSFEYTYRATSVDRAPDVISQAGKLKMPDTLVGHRCDGKYGVLGVVSGTSITPSHYDTKVNGKSGVTSTPPPSQTVSTVYLIRCLEQTPPPPPTTP